MDQDPAFFRITEYSGLWYHDKKTSPHFQHMKAPSPELCFATVPKVSGALELLACSVQTSLPPRPVEEDIQVFGLGQGLLWKHELPNNFPICVVWLRKLCGTMIHNKHNDIDGMMFVRLFQRHAGKIESNMGTLPQNHSPRGPHGAGPSHCGCCVFWQRKSWVLPVAMQQMLVGSELPNSEEIGFSLGVSLHLFTICMVLPCYQPTTTPRTCLQCPVASQLDLKPLQPNSMMDKTLPTDVLLDT